MCTTKCRQFKGEIQNYMRNNAEFFDAKLDDLFKVLKIKTCLCRNNIIKGDGYTASHLLFILFLLPFLKIKTVSIFCSKMWDHWSKSRKDSFYRFKQKAYRWRSFINTVNNNIFESLELSKLNRDNMYFIIDDTILQKLGRMITNVSFVHDHNLGRSVLGYCIVALGLFTGQGFYFIDFAYRFGSKRHPKSSKEIIGDPRTVSGRRSYEAKHFSKLELAFMMIENAVKMGIKPGYILFDSWYSWPSFINKLRNLADKTIHVICRLKNNNVKYYFQGQWYNLSELYRKVKHELKKDSTTGLWYKKIKVKIPDSEELVSIVFCKGYREPEIDEPKGKKKQKEQKWCAFLSTDTNLSSFTVIMKYTMRWGIEVSFKECKQMLELGKDQSNSFDAQVFASTLSFLRYNFLSYLNEKENYGTLGILFEHLVDQSAVITYSQRIWLFFQQLFHEIFKAIFSIHGIEDDFHCYFDVLTDCITQFTPIIGCET